MAYCTVAELQYYTGENGVNNNSLLTSLIARAQSWIELYTDRKFECETDSTHAFTVGQDTDGRMLYLDGDLAAITTITNNADGAAETLTASDYVTYPRNKAPYHAIDIRANSSKTWTYTTDPEGGITVTGKWAYSTTPPEAIKQACIRLAAYLYKQRDAQVFDVTAQPDMGVITIPKGLPADVKQILDGYRRVL